MRMVAVISVESDDGSVVQQSTSSVGVDTRVRGIDPDAAKEDFIAQARGLLTSIGETHVPALYATVQDELNAQKEEGRGGCSGDDGGVRGRVVAGLTRVRAARARKRDDAARDTGPEDATEALKEQV